MEPLKKESFLNNTGKRVLFIISAFFLMYLISYIIDPYSSYWQEYFTRSFSEILEDVVLTLTCGIVISESSIFISKRLNRTIFWTKTPVKRLMIETALNIIMVLFINFLIMLFWVSKTEDNLSSVFSFALSIEETKGTIHWIVVSTAIAFMIMGINTGNHLIISWKNEAMKAARLNQIAMEAELQSLKLQIDPHFVFNNLSVLSELILEDQQLGYEYADNFSRIYRYMLMSSKKDVISMEDELRFLDAYMFLIQQRFGEGVRFEIEVDKASRNSFLPPMTLQLLVENALKHNKTNKKSPLVISIFNNDNQELIVKNTLSLIEKNIDSSEIGIKNINRRYSLLSERQPKITNNGSFFIVNLPLLKG